MWVKSYNNVWVWTNLHQAMLYSMQFHLPNIHDKAGLQSIATVEILCWAFHRLSLFLYKTKEARFKIVPVTEACLAIYNNSGANSKPLKSEGFLIACNWTQKIRFRWLSPFSLDPRGDGISAYRHKKATLLSHWCCRQTKTFELHCGIECPVDTKDSCYNKWIIILN